MPTRVHSLLLIVGMIITVVLVVDGCRSDAGNGQPAAPPVSIRVQTLTPRAMNDVMSVVGIVKAYEDVMISPEEGGVVKGWKVDKGRPVDAGQVIVELKDEIIKASYEAADAQYKMSQLNVDKQEKVFAEQGISEVQYKSLQYGRDAAKANAEIMKARWERTQIKSPVSGILDDQYIDAGEFAPPGMPIAHVVNLSRMKVQAEIPERNAGSIARGTIAVLTFDAFPEETLRGSVSYVGSTVSAANRTLMVEISIPNPDGRLKPEMVAKVRLVRKARTDAILVSENIIQLVDRDRHVVYVEKDGKAEERQLTLGGRDGNNIEILNGLAAGDKLIIQGYQRLVSGQPVLVTE